MAFGTESKGMSGACAKSASGAARKNARTNANLFIPTSPISSLLAESSSRADRNAAQLRESSSELFDDPNCGRIYRFAPQTPMEKRAHAMLRPLLGGQLARI